MKNSSKIWVAQAAPRHRYVPWVTTRRAGVGVVSGLAGIIVAARGNVAAAGGPRHAAHNFSVLGQLLAENCFFNISKLYLKLAGRDNHTYPQLHSLL